MSVETKLCPLSFNQSTRTRPNYDLIKDEGHDYACVKELCAWWIADNVRYGGDGQFLTPEHCVILDLSKKRA